MTLNRENYTYIENKNKHRFDNVKGNQGNKDYNKNIIWK
jgi:hypothetical protein